MKQIELVDLVMKKEKETEELTEKLRAVSDPTEMSMVRLWENNQYLKQCITLLQSVTPMGDAAWPVEWNRFEKLAGKPGEK